MKRRACKTYSKAALARGTRVERREHGLPLRMARKIARDHLCEKGDRAYPARGFSGFAGRRAGITYEATVHSGVIRLRAHREPGAAAPQGRERPLRTVAEVRAYLREHAGYLGLTPAQKRRFREAVSLITAADLTAGRSIPFGGHRAPAGKGLAVQYARSWIEEDDK